MGNMARIYQIDQMLANRRFVPRKELQDRLNVSWATLKRDLAYMKDQLCAPIMFDHDLGGYRFEKEGEGSRIGPQYELPGLWFSAEEIHALLTMQHLLSNLDTGGLLGPQIKPLLARLTGLLGTADNPVEEIQRRIRIQTVGARKFHLDHFQAVGSALLRRKRLVIRYYARGKDEVTEREVSPQRLMHYRDNWYLDAWCHLRDGLRAFSVDAIQHAEILDKKAKDVSDKRLDEVLGSGYGIFSGDEVTWATLRFTPERARWVAAEQWHPNQEGRLLKNGSYELKVPYADDRELIMDIMKYGVACTVVSPKALVDRVTAEFEEAASFYRN
jgi:predicted DNA-binding transcriptional regulator YafY